MHTFSARMPDQLAFASWKCALVINGLNKCTLSVRKCQTIFFFHLTISGTISTDHDSGIESLDSLSPKDMHSTPISSPIAMSSVSNASNIVPEQSTHSASNPKDNVSVLTSLLSAPSKDMSCSTTISPKLLSTFLTSVRPEVKKINVLTINPHNLTLVSEVYS